MKLWISLFRLISFNQKKKKLMIHSSTNIYFKSFYNQKLLLNNYLFKWNQRFISKQTVIPSGTVELTFVHSDNTEETVHAPIGSTILNVAHENNIELEGACGGELACSTCHVYGFPQDVYDSLPEITQEEEDMLDLAIGLTDTSRLGCQVYITEAFAGIKIYLPLTTCNQLNE